MLVIVIWDFMISILKVILWHNGALKIKLMVAQNTIPRPEKNLVSSFVGMVPIQHSCLFVVVPSLL